MAAARDAEVSSEAREGRAAASWIDSRPANGRDRCGDFAECLDLGHRQAIIVGDVSGRCNAASRGAGALRAYARNLVKLRVPLTTGLWLASEFFARAVMTDSVPFASLFIAVADHRVGSMLYASAGHEPGLLFDGGGEHVHLEATGPMLGLGSISVFKERVSPLRLNGLLVVVTDGITQARPPDGDESTIFGSRGVVAAVQDALRQGSDPANAISGAALRHARGRLVDDATVVVSSLLAPARISERASPRRVR
jgi:serine phosphatase RsbU (regulator of sigma subunit)